MSSPLQDLSVLVISEPNDPHADEVEARLAAMGESFARTSLDAWSGQTVEWSSDVGFLLVTGGDRWTIGPGTSVWWRRPGSFVNPHLSVDELELARDEAAVMLPGALDATGVRWVDAPWKMARARNRLVQLALAVEQGLHVPATLMTNSAVAARRFLANGMTVAKAISTGPGIAPFVDIVDTTDVDLVANAPVLLQRMVDADADWRVITVGSRSFGWRRRRAPDGPVDWRVGDPAGADFRSTPMSDEHSMAATTLQDGLKLTFSVQDWLESDGVWWFLGAS